MASTRASGALDANEGAGEAPAAEGLFATGAGVCGAAAARLSRGPESRALQQWASVAAARVAAGAALEGAVGRWAHASAVRCLVRVTPTPYPPPNRRPIIYLNGFELR